MVVGGRLHQGKKAIVGEGGGPLGGLYDPFRLEYDPEVAMAIDAEVNSVNADPDALDTLLERQNFRLAWWRTAGQELDYQRMSRFGDQSFWGPGLPSVFVTTSATLACRVLLSLPDAGGLARNTTVKNNIE